MRFVLPAILWLSAASISSGVSREFPQSSVEWTADHSLGRILGGAKEAVGDAFFMKADEYYHGGATDDFHGGMGPATPTDWVEQVNRLVHAHEDRHLEGEQKKEMLPFFSLAVSLDPRNIQAIVTTAFWLETEYGKPEEALRILEKGRRDNPGSPDISAALGDLHFRRKETAAARAYYVEALAKAPSLEDAEDRRLLEARMRSYLKVLDERAAHAA